MKATLFAGLVGLYAAATAISVITTKGSKFFTDDGEQFFIKGIAYQRSPDDPLKDAEQCRRDARLMSSLGANVIRVYHVDPTGDHDGCMSAFSDAGIYLFVDLDDFETQIEQDDPRWTVDQASAFEAIMDEFHGYDNTAGFFIGNEVLTNGTRSEVAVLVKAATRDLKAYRDSKGYRAIPIGYSHADISSLRPNLQNYLACGSNASDAIDFFGLNAYEWCGQNNLVTSNYQALTDLIDEYPVPIFFSEDGCITERQNNGMTRDFQDQAAIFGPQMAPYWSGAIIYEWIQENNTYGLVTYGGSTDPNVAVPEESVIRSGTPTPMTPDFSALKTAWAAATPSGVKLADYSPSLTPPPCPAATPDVWNVNGDVSIPPLGASLDQAATSSIIQGVGATPTSNPAGPATSSAAANANKDVAGAGFGLMGILLGLAWL